MAPREQVFAVLVDPETYPKWLVGAKEIRAVDDDWPAPGSRFHHRFGLIGPLTIPDSTKVIEIDRPRLLSLEVRARPLGRGRATFTLDDVETGDDRPCTKIAIDEVPLGSMAAATPVLEPFIKSRNVASLNALVAYLNTPSGREPEGT